MFEIGYQHELMTPQKCSRLYYVAICLAAAGVWHKVNPAFSHLNWDKCALQQYEALAKCAMMY